jgi:dTDP-4-dehydrorhamnose reductase
MNRALIGFSGFVGSTLLRQATFESLYRSTNIFAINNKSFDSVVCAGAPAQKWIANSDPTSDLQQIDELIAHLKTIKCKLFILISTVDVFKYPQGVNELSVIDETELQAYGLHRLHLEKFVENHFPEYLIVRLPGLVGPGLKKNVIFDFLNDNNLKAIESRSIFQFYPMINLWNDIQIALNAGLKLIHLTAEPISVADISRNVFGRVFDNVLPNPPVRYDMLTIHAKIYGATGNYQYSASETMNAVRNYAQSEQLTIKPKIEIKI